MALIQLTSAIDLTNPYVNDAFIYGLDYAVLEVDLHQFFVGWGDNGRSELVSQTLPRYFPVVKLADDICVMSWDDDFSYNSDSCFSTNVKDLNIPCSGDEGAPIMFQAIGDSDRGYGDQLVSVSSRSLKKSS